MFTRIDPPEPPDAAAGLHALAATILAVAAIAGVILFI